MQQYKIEFKQLNITPGEVYEAMGYGDAIPQAEIQEETNSLLKEAAAIIHPRFGYLFTEGTLQPEAIEINTFHFQIGKIISRQLKRSEKFALFVATAGKEYEEWVRKYKEKNDALTLFLLDSLGSIIAEKTADYMEKSIASEINTQQWTHTNRYSPGYCGWHLSEQKQLFNVFPSKNPCDIQLTDSCLMLPIKSVSGIIGLGATVKKHDYTCSICDATHCFRRKIKF